MTPRRARRTRRQTRTECPGPSLRKAPSRIQDRRAQVRAVLRLTSLREAGVVLATKLIKRFVEAAGVATGTRVLPRPREGDFKVARNHRATTSLVIRPQQRQQAPRRRLRGRGSEMSGKAC